MMYFEFFFFKSTGDYSFIITTQSREALVNQLSEKTTTLKIIIMILGISGLALGAYCTYKSYDGVRNWLRRRQVAREIEKTRRERLEAERRQRRERGGGVDTESRAADSNLNCVICLSNPRELVLLDCGHVCLCMDCFEQLPSPVCPVCRQAYRDFAPCYLP